MKNLWIKIGCFLTGWNSKILDSCTEASYKQLKKYTSALLILMILWGLIGYLFAERYVGLPWWGCSIVAFFMIIIVVQIERQITLTVGKNRGRIYFRGFIAIIMAVIGSAIIDQIIFKDDIEKKMIEIVDRQVKERLPNHLTVIDSRLRELQMEIDSLDRKNLQLYEEISKQPTIQTISTTTSPITIRQADGTDIVENRTSITRTPILNPKNKEVEINNQYLEVLRTQQEDYTKRKMDAENSLRVELKSKQGFLEELKAVFEILGGSGVALTFYGILFFFLFSLELFVVVSKIGDKECDYDLVVKHQLAQKEKTLNNLAT